MEAQWLCGAQKVIVPFFGTITFLVKAEWLCSAQKVIAPFFWNYNFFWWRLSGAQKVRLLVFVTFWWKLSGAQKVIGNFLNIKLWKSA